MRGRFHDPARCRTCLAVADCMTVGLTPQECAHQLGIRPASLHRHLLRQRPDLAAWSRRAASLERNAAR